MAAGAGDVYSLNWIGSIFGQRIMLTTAYEILTVDAGVEPSDVRSAMLVEVCAGGGNDLIESDYLACLPPSYTLNRVTAQPFYPIRLVYEDAVRNVAGTHASDTEASNQSAVITFQTEYAGRDQVSNKHIGPIPQAATVQANGELVAAYKALLTTLGDSLTSNIVVAGLGLSMFPVVFHKNAEPPVSKTDRLIEFYVNDEIRVMRRRTVRVGE